MASELADHGRRVDVADGAVTSLKEKKKLLDDVKKTPDVENRLSQFDSEIERHEKIIKAEGKIVDAVKEKKDKNKKDYEEHIEKCAKAKKKALVATAGVNDAATTLKNQREFQVQVT
jgi:predicted RND superfamily exporter protein